jgi:hypothetical protein
MTANRPTLALEEIEDQLDEITCWNSAIELKFTAAENLKAAYEELMSVSTFNLIT